MPRTREKELAPSGKRRLKGGENGIVRIGRINTRIMNGEEDLSIWSEEELRRGRRMSKRGRWEGRAPAIVPKAVHDELVKRTLDDAQKLMRENLVAAVSVLIELVQDEEVDAREKVKAIDMIMTRVMGKPPEKVEVTGEMKPWEMVLSAGVVRDTSSDDDILILDDEDDEEDEDE